LGGYYARRGKCSTPIPLHHRTGFDVDSGRGPARACVGHDGKGIVRRACARPSNSASRLRISTPQVIAAKRYALYTKTHSDIEIVEPKAHGLGYFYPPKDSAKGWNHETPEWIFKAWNWLMRGVLGLKRKRPEWLDRPVMMKLTLSTPHHALKNLAKGPITRPNNFRMIPQISRFGYPQDVDPNKCTFITSFSSERHQWIHSKCINIHDHQSRIYELADEYDGRRAVPENFFTLMESYQNHPEAKSLGPDGKPCEFDTRGLLQRAHIVANWPPIYIGKESDRHWEEGDDLSLLEFRTIEYKRKGYVIANDKQLERITRVPKRELRRRGINQHTLRKSARKCLCVRPSWHTA
jgi:hypothetical protein